MLLFERLKRFIVAQSRNYKVLLVRGTVALFLTELVFNFNNLYIVALGATPFQLSIVRAAGRSVGALISIPSGWLSDMYSTKKILILGMIIQILSVVFYAFAQNWMWIIMAMVLSMITMTLVWRAQGILIANSLSKANRATGYGFRQTIMEVFGIFAPTIGGIVIYLLGGISVESIRPLYFIQLIGFVAITIYTSSKLQDVVIDTSVKVRDLLRHYKEMFKSGTGLKHMRRFAFIQALGGFTMGMSTLFPFVYAVNFKGADPLTIGFMGTGLGVVCMFLALPLGYVADRKGRKFAIFLTRPFFYGSFLLLIFAPKGASWLLVVAWCMRGVWMGSHAWMVMSMEMVPQEYRGRWMGFNGLLQNSIRVPAALIGGYLYESVNPILVFLIPIIVDVCLRMPILATIPDTLKKLK